MKLILSLLILLTTLSLFAQNLVTGTLKDAETGNPIAYANIGIAHRNVGTVSGELGKFEFEIPLIMETDSVKLSCIGYKTKSILAKEFSSQLSKNPVVTLIPDITELKEVVVKSNKLKQKRVGNKTKSKLLRGGFRYASLGHEIGTKINIKNRPTYVMKFHTNIVSNTNETMKFRMNFYDIKKGIPNKKIFHENIIFQIEIKEGPFTLDLTEYNILINKDFYCTIELIENQKPDDFLFFSAGILANKMIYRLTSHGEWEKIGAIGIGFNVTVEH